MKSPLSVLKYLLLALFLLGIVFGFIFFRVWQENERPTATEISWTKSEILLGQSNLLEMEISAPWHRSFTNPKPLGSAEGLVTVTQDIEVQKGSLKPNGHRTWTVRLPFVPVQPGLLEGRSISLPIARTDRISPTTVNATLPPLQVQLPENLPENLNDPQKFLTTAPPETISDRDSSSSARSYWWLWVLIALAILGLIFLFLKKTGLIQTTPPWEKALARLDKVSATAPPKTTYTKLSDILRDYVSDRYDLRARTKTTTEFLNTIKFSPDFPSDHLNELTAFANFSDEVKFADQIPEEGQADKSIQMLREFVRSTIPQEETSSPRS